VNTVFRDERKRTCINADGADKPLKSSISEAMLNKARAYRLSRMRQLLAETGVERLDSFPWEDISQQISRAFFTLYRN